MALAYHHTQARVLGPGLVRHARRGVRPPVCEQPSPRTIARSATSGKDTLWPRDQESKTAGGQLRAGRSE